MAKSSEGDTALSFICRNKLFYRCSNEILKFVQFFASNKDIDLTIKNSCEDTILHDAYDKLDILKYLISLNKTDITTKNEEGQTVLHVACEEGNLKVVENIISHNKIRYIRN